MKKVTLLAALVFSTAAFSQKIKISEIHISNGSGSMGTQDGNLTDFAKLAPNSAILGMDLSQLTPYSYMYFNGFRMNSGSNSTSLQLGLHIRVIPTWTQEGLRCLICFLRHRYRSSSQASRMRLFRKRGIRPLRPVQMR